MDSIEKMKHTKPCSSSLLLYKYILRYGTVQYSICEYITTVLFHVSESTNWSQLVNSKKWEARVTHVA